MKDFRLQVRVKNNRILQRIEEMGFKSVAAFCRHAGLADWTVGMYINMRESPRDIRDGSWKKAVRIMARCLGVSPEDLFSEEQEQMSLKRNTAEANFSASQVLAVMSDPEERILKDEQCRLLYESLSLLNKNEQITLWSRFGMDGEGERTLAEVGEHLGMTRERVRQIEQKGLSKLKEVYEV